LFYRNSYDSNILILSVLREGSLENRTNFELNSWKRLLFLSARDKDGLKCYTGGDILKGLLSNVHMMTSSELHLLKKCSLKVCLMFSNLDFMN